jgi:hypothetical protein
MRLLRFFFLWNLLQISVFQLLNEGNLQYNSEFHSHNLVSTDRNYIIGPQIPPPVFRLILMILHKHQTNYEDFLSHIFRFQRFVTSIFTFPAAMDIYNTDISISIYIFLGMRVLSISWDTTSIQICITVTYGILMACYCVILLIFCLL